MALLYAHQVCDVSLGHLIIECSSALGSFTSQCGQDSSCFLSAHLKPCQRVPVDGLEHALDDPLDLKHAICQ